MGLFRLRLEKLKRRSSAQADAALVFSTLYQLNLVAARVGYEPIERVVAGRQVNNLLKHHT